MLRASLVFITLLGCAPRMGLGPVVAPRALPMASINSPDFERPATLATWSRVVEDQDTTRIAPEPVDPTTLLAWPTPPASVGCVVRGTAAPFAEPCQQESVTVHVRGVDIAKIRVEGVALVWGIPHGRALGSGLWVHGRSGGVSVTGHARKTPQFAVRTEVMVVKDHVWAKKDAPVIPMHSDRGVRVEIQDEVLGVGGVKATLPCEELAFEPLELPVVTAMLSASSGPPILRYPNGAKLTLFEEPGGAIVTTLRSGNEGPLILDLEVMDTRGAFTRVKFETSHARFDVWVASAALGEESGLRYGGRGIGCGGSGFSSGGRTSTSMGKTSAIHLGTKAAEARPAGGLEIAAGSPLYVLDHIDGFVAVQPYDSLITPLTERRFWVPEAALSPP